MNHFNITELPSGIRVVSENIPYLKSFSLGFWFDVGSRDENPDNNGISHFLEHMFFKGTKRRTAKQIADEIESLGGYLNAFTSKEHTCIYGRGLSRHLSKTFNVIADMIQFSLFRESDIKKEAAVIIDELKDIEDSPEELIFDKFENKIYLKHNLGMPIIGREEIILRINSRALSSFIRDNYGFNNFYIVASGAVDHQKIIELTNKYIVRDFSTVRKKRSGYNCKPAADLFIYKDILQSHLVIGRTTYGFKDKKRTAVNVLSHLLGEGSSSRLFQAVREKNGIAYQINSFLNSYYDVSTFGVYMSTNEKSFDKASSLIYNEFRKLRTKKISDRELKRVKEYLKGNILMNLESTTNRMLRIANSVIYLGKIKKIEETVKEIDAVSTNDILELSNDILEEKYLSKVVISSKNHLLQTAA